jgi:hypothetical protein
MTMILLLCIAGTMQAQHSLLSELNKFRADDVLIKQQVSYKDPGRTGANVLWDFSQLNIVNDEYELAYSAGRDSVIIGTEHLTRYSYVLSNDSLLLWGFRNPTTQMRNKQPEVLLKFPVNYGDSIKNYYYGHGKHGNRLELDDMGTIATSADAYGMMVLPNQDTLKHVLRTHTVKYIAKDTKPISEEYQLKDTTLYLISADSIDFRLANDTVVFVTETFRWYEQGYRYPVFETIRSWEQHESKRKRYEFLATAFFYPPQEQYYLQDDANLAVLDSLQNENFDPWAGLTYNIYPNPVRTQPLNIELYLPQSATVRVQVRNTMGTVLIDKNQGNYPVGICNFQINLQGLQTNNYILDIWLNEKLISETIMKR